MNLIKLGLLALFACAGHHVLAHDARPVVLDISAQEGGAYRYLLTVPDSVSVAGMPVLDWPGNCLVQPGPDQPVQGSAGTVICAGGLEELELGLDWPLGNPSLSLFIRLSAADGSQDSALYPPSQHRWKLPADPGAATIFFQYFQAGIEHLLTGYDHLLFVVGLMVVAGSMRRLLFAVTGFTLAHSLTLGLSVLEVIRVAVPPTEAVIALSILYLAAEIAGGDRQAPGFRFSSGVAFFFGLLHGLGFASVLAEIGVAENALVLSLLAFNLGIEAGQVLFIVLVLLLLLLPLRALAKSMVAAASHRRLGEVAVAWLIGVPSAFWLIERVSQFA